MKKMRNIAFEYMLELGIVPAKNGSGFISQLKKACDEETVEKIVSIISTREEDETEEKGAQNRFYAAKNVDLKTSVAVTGGFNGDTIRKICDWICTHTEAFGKRILDIGCDDGVVTCFIAKMLPDAEITAVDRCEAGIRVAQELAKKLKVKNIHFRHVSDLGQIEEKYDTVFSSRTMNENLDKAGFVEDQTWLLIKQGKDYEGITHAYAKKLAALIKDGGNLISIERVGRNALYLGWLYALNSNGMIPDYEKYTELVCRELDKTDVAHQVTIARKQEPVDEMEIYAIFCSSFVNKIDLTCAQYYDWDAAIMLQNSLDQLIEGYRIYERDGTCVAKVALWTCRSDRDSILGEQHLVPRGYHCLSNCYLSALENCRKSIRDTVRGALAVCQTVRKLKYENGCEIETEVIHSID